MPVIASTPDTLAVPWSWSIAQLGPQITESMRQTLLARFRKLGCPVTSWAVLAAGPPWTWSVGALGAQLTAAQQQTLLARFRALKFTVTAWPT